MSWREAQGFRKIPEVAKYLPMAVYDSETMAASVDNCLFNQCKEKCKAQILAAAWAMLMRWELEDEDSAVYDFKGEARLISNLDYEFYEVYSFTSEIFVHEPYYQARMLAMAIIVYRKDVSAQSIDVLWEWIWNAFTRVSLYRVGVQQSEFEKRVLAESTLPKEIALRRMNSDQW